MSYSDKLKDPRWQRKRLEILSRDNFTCKMCSNDKETLHVHHNKYFKNPWDADTNDLETLCVTCHSFVEFCKTHKVTYSNVEVHKSLVSNSSVYIFKYKLDEVDTVSLATNYNGYFEFIFIAFQDKLINKMLNHLNHG